MRDPIADVLLHPVRIRIVVTIFDRELTTRQIAAAIPDVAQASLYRHIDKLTSAGILRVVEQRQVRGTLEKVYTTVREATSLGSYVSKMESADWSRAFSAFTAFLVGQFEAYIKSDSADPVADGLSFRTVPLYLSDEEMTQLAAEIRQTVLSRLQNTPAPGRHRRQISTIVIPDPSPAENGEFS